MNDERELAQLRAEAKVALPVLTRYIVEKLLFVARAASEACHGVVLAYEDLARAKDATDPVVVTERLREWEYRFGAVEGALQEFRKIGGVVEALEALRQFAEGPESAGGGGR